MTATIIADKKLNTPGTLKLLAEIRAARGGDARIDASGVEMLGALALQVLLSARASWAADGHAFDVTPRSEPVEGALALTGLAPADLATGDAA